MLTYPLAVIGQLSIGVGLCMLLPMGVSLFYGEVAWRAFMLGSIISVGVGLGMFWLFRPTDKPELNHRAGMAIVAFGWLAAGLLGAIPLFLSGDFASFTDAAFESISGFTTTGASILTNIEAAGKGVLFWRSLTHWLGGMGFIVLSIAILPFLGVGGMELYKAEAPSPTPDRLAPRIRDTASALWKVYLVLTVAEALLLLAGGMQGFDAVCHAMATMATGGFSTKNASIGAYDSAYIQWVVTLFMFLAGVNFSLHFAAFKGRFGVYRADEEWRFYAILFTVMVVGVSLGLWIVSGSGFEHGLRQAAFQVATILTTTGFATTDYTLWPAFSLTLLLALMFVGGSAGSTGGGPKCMRVWVILKQTYSELLRLVHPRVVAPVKLSGRTVEREVLASVWGFMGLYLTSFLVVAVVLTAMGQDIVVAFSASIACLGNIGPGLGAVGPAGNYADLPLIAKWLLSIAMIVGRLEIYTVLVLLLPEFWRK